MGKLTFETVEHTQSVEQSISVSDYLASKYPEYENIKEYREALIMFDKIANNNLNEDNSINYNGITYTMDELLEMLINEAKKERRLSTDKIVDDFIASFTMFDGSLINNGSAIDLVEDMKERAFASYDYETKTVAYVLNKRLTLSELYYKYRTVNVEEQNVYTNAELCQDMAKYIDPSILESKIEGMNTTVEDYLVNTLPSLMHDGLSVDMEGELIPVQVFVKQIVDHQYEYINRLKEEEERIRDEELNRTNENPNLVGLINIAMKGNDALEVTTEMPVLQASLLTDEETSSLKESALISTDYTSVYYYLQISRLKVAINKTTSEHDLAYQENILNELISSIKEENMSPEVSMLIESVKDLITKKRNGFIKLNINSEDLIDITHGILNELNNSLNGITSSDQFIELNEKANALYLDLISKGVKDIQLDAKLISFLNELEKKRMIYDATLTNISAEIQQIKFDLDEQMKRIRQEILAIECNKTSLNQLSGKIIMISHLIDKAKTDVLNASHNHRFSDYNNKFTNDSLNYYLSQLEMYDVALDNMNKIGYGYR